MRWEELNKAVVEARSTIRLADMLVRQLADMVRGKLRSGDVGHSALCDLKKELQNFNMHTGQWKN